MEPGEQTGGGRVGQSRQRNSVNYSLLAGGKNTPATGNGPLPPKKQGLGTPNAAALSHPTALAVQAAVQTGELSSSGNVSRAEVLEI